MFQKKAFSILLAWSALAALPAFSQEEFYRQEISGQALGSFVKDTWQNGVKQSATDGGGVLASYRFLFDQHNAVEVNYGYSLNTQRYTSASSAFGVNSYSNEVTAAYVRRFPLTQRWTLFALAGTGAIVFDPKNTNGIDYQARAVALYGGGVDAAITTHLFVRAEYRGLIYNSPTYNLASLRGEDRVAHRFEPTVGFGWRF